MFAYEDPISRLFTKPLAVVCAHRNWRGRFTLDIRSEVAVSGRIPAEVVAVHCMIGTVNCGARKNSGAFRKLDFGLLFPLWALDNTCRAMDGKIQ